MGTTPSTLFPSMEGDGGGGGDKIKEGWVGKRGYSEGTGAEGRGGPGGGGGGRGEGQKRNRGGAGRKR